MASSTFFISSCVLPSFSPSISFLHIRSKIMSILVGFSYPSSFKNNQSSSLCNAYSILSHSKAISCCFRRVFKKSPALKLDLFSSSALISSALVSPILPILSLVNTVTGFSSTDSYQMNFTLFVSFSAKSSI